MPLLSSVASFVSDRGVCIVVAMALTQMVLAAKRFGGATDNIFGNSYIKQASWFSNFLLFSPLADDTRGNDISISNSAGTHMASSQPRLERAGARRLRKTAAISKAPSNHLNHLTVEPRRLKSKQEALERRKLLTIRTGSLYDFVSPNPSSLGSSSLVRPLLQQSTNKC